MLSQIFESAEFIRGKGVANPEIGIILGTGLGKTFIRNIIDPVTIPYEDIPHFPVSTVDSHKGALVYGTVQGKRVLIMQGRFHYYEGYSMQQITLPVRAMKVLGIETLLISNAGGKLNPNWKTGELMLLDDHINLLSENPLRGRNLDEFGPRFPDMSSPYDNRLNKLLTTIACEKGVVLYSGVYACVQGPNLETRAEYRYLRIIGADAVGMSTVPEAIIANHMKLPCCAVSVLTDDCDPDNLKPIELKDIIAIAERVEVKLSDLWVELISRM
jgi:purine-nucleoside phosphorylase